MRLFLLFLSALVPCFGATVTGKVRADARPLSDAKIVVFHEMALIFLQRGVSDRNGQYVFNLEPGPYRIWVLKEGFFPRKVKVTILKRDQQIKLDHDLLPNDLVPRSETTQYLKKYLRNRNKEPYRSTEGPVLIDTSLTPSPDQSLVGTVSSQTRQDIQGGTGQQSTVEVATWLNDQIRVDSRLTNERYTDSSDETLQIQAGLTMDLNALGLEVRAESIQPMEERDQTGGSKHIAVTGQYQRDFKTTTSISYRSSKDGSFDQQEVQLSQTVDYSILDQPLKHEVNLTGWEQNNQSLAERATVVTSWKQNPEGVLGLRTDLDTLALEDSRTTITKFWMTGEHQAESWQFQSRLGVQQEEDNQDLIHYYRIHSDWGHFRFAAEYSEDSQLQPYSSRDIFGLYLPRPITPYANESFYSNNNRETGVSLGYDHGRGWNSQMNWSQSQDRARLLQAHNAAFFKPEAEHQSRYYAYSLASDRLGTRIELSHGVNEGDQVDFSHTGLRYTQLLNPFRGKGPGIFVELQMTSHPVIPAWWLLDEMPWDPEIDNTWYQGHLSLQF